MMFVLSSVGWSKSVEGQRMVTKVNFIDKLHTDLDN